MASECNAQTTPIPTNTVFQMDVASTEQIAAQTADDLNVSNLRIDDFLGDDAPLEPKEDQCCDTCAAIVSSLT